MLTCGLSCGAAAYAMVSARSPPPFALASPASNDVVDFYAPFVQRALDLFEEAGLEMRPYPMDSDFKVCETISGSGSRQQPVRLRTTAFCTDKLRQVRLVHIEGGSALQVLNFCAFPALEYGCEALACRTHALAVPFVRPKASV